MSLLKFAYEMGAALAKEEMQKEAGPLAIAMRGGRLGRDAIKNIRKLPVGSSGRKIRKQKALATAGAPAAPVAPVAPAAATWGGIGRDIWSKMKGGGPLTGIALGAGGMAGINYLRDRNKPAPLAANTAGLGGMNLDPAGSDPLYNYMTRAGIRQRNLQSVVNYMNNMMGQ